MGTATLWRTRRVSHEDYTGRAASRGMAYWANLFLVY